MFFDIWLMKIWHILVYVQYCCTHTIPIDGGVRGAIFSMDNSSIARPLRPHRGLWDFIFRPKADRFGYLGKHSGTLGCSGIFGPPTNQDSGYWHSGSGHHSVRTRDKTPLPHSQIVLLLCNEKLKCCLSYEIKSVKHIKKLLYNFTAIYESLQKWLYRTYF